MGRGSSLEQSPSERGHPSAEMLEPRTPGFCGNNHLAVIINVKNGLLNVETGQLEPHTPNHLSPIQIPVHYDPKATCPETEKFVVRVFPPGAVDLAWDIYGHLMVPDTSMQKSFLLSGDGGNGKSTWLAALTAFLGRENISTISLQDLADTRFHGAELVGKLANICADLSGKQLAETGVFKKITGGDRNHGRAKASALALNILPGSSSRPTTTFREAETRQKASSIGGW